MMNEPRSLRWKIEAITATVFALGAVLTALFPQWIEALGFDPDNGSGAAEWAMVGLFGSAFLVLAIASSVHTATGTPRTAHQHAVVQGVERAPFGGRTA